MAAACALEGILKAYMTRTGYKSKQRGVPGIRKGTLVVKAQWYDATDDTGRKYKLLPETVHVTVCAPSSKSSSSNFCAADQRPGIVFSRMSSMPA